MESPFLPWYIAGPLIGVFVVIFLFVSGKQLGISSSLRSFFHVIGLRKLSYFGEESKKDVWQILFVLGLILSSFFAFQLLDFRFQLSNEPYASVESWIFLLGGLFIGFGSRYANGCTAGHCIMGNAVFALSSIIATIGFFAGGLLVSHFVNPYLF